jgi:hypothetical protein
MRGIKHAAVAIWLIACGGGAEFKMVETPWSASEDANARLTRGAQKIGCTAGAPDSTGEIEIQCPAREGSLRIGPGSDKRLLAMCNDGLAERCPETLEEIWKAGE